MKIHNGCITFVSGSSNLDKLSYVDSWLLLITSNSVKVVHMSRRKKNLTLSRHKYVKNNGVSKHWSRHVVFADSFNTVKRV